MKIEVKEKRGRGLTHIPTLVGIVRRMEGEGGQEKKNFGRDRLRVVFHYTLCDVLHARLWLSISARRDTSNYLCVQCVSGSPHRLCGPSAGGIHDSRPMTALPQVRTSAHDPFLSQSQIHPAG